MEAATRTYQEASSNQRRDQLIMDHVDFVHRIYGSVAANLPNEVDEENLRAAGILGLIEAAQNFDPQRGVPFKTFAYPRIRGAIVDELRRNSPLSQRIMQRIGILRSIMESIEPPVTPELIAEKSGLTMEEVEECLEAMQLTRLQSWESVSDSVEQHRQYHVGQPEDRIEKEEILQRLAECIKRLPERERIVLTLYHEQNLRLKEIGEVLEISESRVSRILAKAQFRVREMFRVTDGE